MTLAFCERRAVSFWSATANIPRAASSLNCASVGPCHRPTNVLTPIDLNSAALRGSWSQTPTGKKFGSAGKPLRNVSISELCAASHSVSNTAAIVESVKHLIFNGRFRSEVKNRLCTLYRLVQACVARKGAPLQQRAVDELLRSH